MVGTRTENIVLDDVRGKDCHLVLLVIRTTLLGLFFSQRTYSKKFLKKTKKHVLEEILRARL